MTELKYLHQNDVHAYNAVMSLLTRPVDATYTTKMAKQDIHNILMTYPMHWKLHRHLENILTKPTTNFRQLVQDEIECYEDYISVLAIDPNDSEWDLLDIDLDRAKKLYQQRTNFPDRVVDLVFNSCVESN